jgi:hypothetical protein
MVMPSHEPDKASRDKVESMSALGIPQADIARVIGICEETLRKHYREELDNATTKANTQIGGALFRKALSGDTASLIFWMKTRAGWKETSVHEHSGGIKSERELTEADRALIDLAIDHKINGGKDGRPKQTAD